jgi:enoyl-CoA hydratase
MEPVQTEVADGVAVITLDDGKANALSPAMQIEIHGHLDRVEADAEVRAIVLAGRPGVFSGGFDLAVMRSGDVAAIVEMVASGGDLVRRIYGMGVPVVAAATGHAVAAGAFLLLACDVRVGADADVSIGANEVSIGMALPEWAITICAHRLSNRHLNRSMLTARLTDGRTAVDVGFLDRVVPPDDVVAAAVAEAAALTALDRPSYVEMVRRYRGAVLAEMAEEIADDRASIADA